MEGQNSKPINHFIDTVHHFSETKGKVPKLPDLVGYKLNQNPDLRKFNSEYESYGSSYGSVPTNVLSSTPTDHYIVNGGKKSRKSKASLRGKTRGPKRKK